MKQILAITIFMLIGYVNYSQDEEAPAITKPETNEQEQTPEPQHYDPDAEERIWVNSDELPVYKGGLQALYAFIAKNVIYPQTELDANIEGTVYLTFVVEKNGSTSNHKVVQGVAGGPGLDAEALRICKLIQFEKPAYKDGFPVKTNYRLPIKFKLDDNIIEADKWQYEGGIDSLNAKLRREIITPTKKWKKLYKSKLLVALEIDANGKIKDMEVRQPNKKIDKHLRTEVTRIFNAANSYVWGNKKSSPQRNVIVYEFYIDTEFVANSKAKQL